MKSWPFNVLLAAWSFAATCAAVSHLLLPGWTAQGTNWASEVHWQREIAYFDVLLSALFLWVAAQRNMAFKSAACAGIACLSLALGFNHLQGWLAAPRVFHVVFTLGNFAAVVWAVVAVVYARLHRGG